VIKKTYFYRIGKVVMLFIFSLMCSNVSYAGVALGATRVIYPAGQKQVQLPVTNNDQESTYLIQSWVEDANGKKEGTFIVTPPLFTMKGKKENTLRIIDVTNGQLAKDRESLFWLNVKAIPAVDKDLLKSNNLQIAIVSKIKLIYRPSDLDLPPEEAPSKVRFKRVGNLLTIKNPTPYYLTLTEINAGTRVLENALVPPMGKIQMTIPADSGSEITYKAINDYGALTQKIVGKTE